MRKVSYRLCTGKHYRNETTINSWILCMKMNIRQVTIYSTIMYRIERKPLQSKLFEVAFWIAPETVKIKYVLRFNWLVWNYVVSSGYSKTVTSLKPIIFKRIFLTKNWCNLIVFHSIPLHSLEYLVNLINCETYVIFKFYHNFLTIKDFRENFIVDTVYLITHQAVKFSCKIM